MQGLSYQNHMAFLSYDPAIIYVEISAIDRAEDGSSGVEALAEAIGLEIECHIVLQPWWTLMEPRWGERTRPLVERLRERFPKLRLTMFCAEPEEIPIVEDVGFNAELISHNIFIKEEVFYPEYGVSKVRDAFYNGKFQRLKRHHLASSIDSLAIAYSKYGLDDKEYVESVRRALPQAEFLNGFGPEYRTLNPIEIRRQLNASRVALALSEREGGMQACQEALLCGIPVVSTYNRGGRNLFLDARHSRIVAPDPKAIADAVHRLISFDLDPWEVRDAALEKTVTMRQVLIDFISREQAKAGRPAQGRWEFERIRKDWLGMKWMTIGALLAERQAHMGQ